MANCACECYNIDYINKEHIQRQHWLHTLYTGTARNHQKQKLRRLTRRLTRKPHQYSRVYVFYLHCRCIRTSSELKSATDLVLVRLLHSMWHQWRIHWRTPALLACTLCSATVYVYYDHSSQIPGTTSVTHSVSHSLAHARTPSLQQVTDIRAADMWHYLTLPHIAVHWVSE